MTQRMERRLGRLETRQQHLTVVAMARRIGPEVDMEVEALVAETEEILAECQRYGLRTREAMIEHVAAKDGISPEELRHEMDALGATAR